MFGLSRTSFTGSLTGSLAVALCASLATPGTADSQLSKRLKQAVTRAAESETVNQVDRFVRGKVRCVFDDLECIRRAEKSGKGAVLTDDDGKILVDEQGKPTSDPKVGSEIASREEGVARPGEGAWANYDFTPGDDILFADDFSGDEVGDFPRRFALVEGSFEIIEWNGARQLRATSNGLVAIPLPKTLPERFTVEYSVHLTHGNAFARMMPDRAYFGPARRFQGSAASVEMTRAGIRAVGSQGPTVLSTVGSREIRDAMVPVRIMGDGEHLKVYLGERRVANAPNAVFPRGDTLFLAVGWASEKTPVMIGAIRIAGGGRELYDRLARDGRVATQGILFASGSARIRPESTPTLAEIGAMLRDHPELRIAIEGHTDSDGDDAFNKTLSEQRAAAVKAHLTSAFGIDATRLEAAGYGESRPVGDNATPEGKQQNRRVELVRLSR